MASIYRPTYTDPKTGQLKKSKTWRIAFKDASGRRRTVSGFRDKTATEAKARELERLAQRAQAGLPITDIERKRHALSELTTIWISELYRLGRSDVHVKEQERLLTKLWTQCKWDCLATIRVDRLTTFLAQLQSDGKSPRTLNAYRDALHTFLAFCKRQRWLEENPLAGYPKARSNGQKTRPRRAYTIEEFRSLCNNSKDHGTLYLVAGLSGLRKSELRKLEKRDVTPNGKTPCWHLRPEITKARRREIVSMLPDVVPTVRGIWKEAEGPTSRLFPRIPRTATLHKDLKRAKIIRIDAEGRYVDFHSLRYFFCTFLAKHLPIQTVRLLMRHRDIRQTCNLYMDLGLTDITQATQQLPSLLAQPLAISPPNQAISSALQ